MVSSAFASHRRRQFVGQRTLRQREWEVPLLPAVAVVCLIEANYRGHVPL